jgi:hypothetical protein
LADGGIAGYATVGNDGNAAPNPASGPAGQLAFNNEPVMRMAGGGIAGYAVGGSPDYSPDVYRRYAIQKAREMGVNPTLADSIFRIESGYNPNAKSKTGPVGIGQLAAETAKGYGLDPNERMDGFKNIDASLAFIKDLQGKYNNDPQKVAVAYNQGETFLNKHLKQNEGALVPEKLNKPEANNYLKKLGAAVTGFIPSAQAETVPGKAPADLIPGQTAKAPASNYEQTNTYFGGVADRLGISPEVQRNISNTLNALGGYSSPVSSVGRGVGAASKALEPTAEMIAKAEQTKNAVALPRIGYSAGIEGLTPEAQAMRDLAVANKQKAILNADRATAQGAEQSVNAATQTADIARKMEQDMAASRQATRLNEAKMSGAAQGFATMNDAEKAMMPTTAKEPQYPNENGPEDRGDMFAPPPATDKTGTTKQTEEPKQGRDWNDLLLNLGLGLMAGQSPYALQNLGTAGLGALRSEQEKKRLALEERKELALEALQKQQGQYYGAQAGYLEDMRGPQAALASADRNFVAWQNSPAGLGATPEQARATHDYFIKDAYKNLGIIHPSSFSAEDKRLVEQYAKR